MSLKILNPTDMVWSKDFESSVDSKKLGHHVDGTSKATKSTFTGWRCYELMCRLDERPFIMQHYMVSPPQQNFCWRLVLRSWRKITWVHVWALLEIELTFVTVVMASIGFALPNSIFICWGIFTQDYYYYYVMSIRCTIVNAHQRKWMHFSQAIFYSR